MPEYDHKDEPCRNKNLEAQKSSESPKEEAKVSQQQGNEIEHLDDMPEETKASKKCDKPTEDA